MILGTPAFAANADNGKRLFVKDGCYQCHGYQGQGGAAGARLAPRPIVLAALTAYVRHPTGQMPPLYQQGFFRMPTSPISMLATSELHSRAAPGQKIFLLLNQ